MQVAAGNTLEFLIDNFPTILVILIILFLISHIIRKIHRDKLPTDHWQRQFFSLNISSQEFYKAVEAAITALGEPRISTSRVTYFEHGLMSNRREFLRVVRDDWKYDICAAPFGTGFFVSYRQIYTRTIGRNFIRSIPKIGPVLEAAIYSQTYYQLDTAEMFNAFVTKIVEDTAATLASDRGVRGMPELGSKPVEQVEFQ